MALLASYWLGPMGSIVPIVVITALFLLGLPVFAIQYRLRGQPRTERIQRSGGTVLMNEWIMEYGYWFMGAGARVFLWLRCSADVVTLLGFMLIAGGSVAVGFGYFGLGGWLILFGSMFDAMDGIVARESGRSSNAGEFLDSIVDRYAEIASYIGLCYYYNDRPWAMAAVLCGLLGSLMLSYSRAKAEALGVTDAPSGLMRRHERAVYLGLGIALAPVLAHWLERGNPHPFHHLTVVACAAVGILANFSALDLSRYVKRRLEKKPVVHP